MFDFDPVTIFFSLLFSTIGFAYTSYGKKHSTYFQYAGWALVILTFCVDNLSWLIGTGVALLILPFILEKYW